MSRAAVRSLAVHFPAQTVTNDALRARFPSQVAAAETESLGRVWSAPKDQAPLAFDLEMSPYLSDPFRGAKERRWLAEGESTVSLELVAARGALEAAKLRPRDLDLVIACSFFPDMPNIGNAAFLARALELSCEAWNLESACSGVVVALQTACALVESGRHERVLVVSSCSYSRSNEPADTLSWGNGDGAAALVVTRARDDAEGLLAGHTVSTWQTCGAVENVLALDDKGDPFIRMRVSSSGGRVLRVTAEPLLRACVEGALAKARLKKDDIAFFAFPTPTAWYASFCARVLGIDPERTINMHPRLANMGPVLTPANLYFGARAGRVRAGDLVLLYGVGSVSNASAAILRWGDVALGAPPDVALTPPPAP